MDLPVIFEDDYLLAIDKPAGLVVNRRENEDGKTVQDWSEKRLAVKYSRDNEFTLRSGIIHRLDKDTSGILLIAKNWAVFNKMQLLFKNRQIEKYYFALVHGRVSPELKEITVPVGRLPWNRRKFGVLPQGREAVTLIDVVNYYHDKDGNNYSLIKAAPKTGRSHQIRIHLKYVGHSLVSDSLYSGRKTLKTDLKICPRIFLHAARISFIHPINGGIISLVSPLPQDLENSLRGLKRMD